MTSDPNYGIENIRYLVSWDEEPPVVEEPPDDPPNTITSAIKAYI